MRPYAGCAAKVARRSRVRPSYRWTTARSYCVSGPGCQAFCSQVVVWCIMNGSS